MPEPLSEAMRAFPLLRRVEHAPGLCSLVFQRPFDARPGQFAFAWIPDLGERPFSISELDGEELELTVKAVGPVSRALCALRPGDRVGLRGPFGRAFEASGPAVLLGGGIGIAPIRFLARDLARQGRRVPILLGARSAAEIPFAEDFAGLGARFATDDGSLGRRGLVHELLHDLPMRAGTTLCACGPEPMLLALRRIAQDLELPVQLSFERVMKCGLGLCGQCCMEGSGVRLCAEGPVLDEPALARIEGLGGR